MTSNPHSSAALFPGLYDELKAIARIHMRREGSDHSLQTSDLLHMAYVSLLRQNPTWTNEIEFKRVASRVMRHLLIDHARAKKSLKRGGRWTRIELTDALTAVESDHLDMLALENALKQLNGSDPRAAEVFELRFFGGLTEVEIAQAVEVSPRTARRLWALAKAWIRANLAEAEPD